MELKPMRWPEEVPVNSSGTIIKDNLVELQKMVDGTWKAVDTGNTPATVINIFYIPPNQRDIPRSIFCLCARHLTRTKKVGTYPLTEEVGN